MIKIIERIIGVLVYNNEHQKIYNLSDVKYFVKMSVNECMSVLPNFIDFIAQKSNEIFNIETKRADYTLVEIKPNICLI